jgi:hypothetical protein
MEEIEVAMLAMRNPADTFKYDITPAAIVADRVLNLPVITATDTLAVLGLAQTFSAAQTFTSTVTVGVSDTGHDVQFFGATANTYMLWDENTDDLVLTLGAELYLYDAAGGEHIKSDGTNMTIYAGTDLNLTAGTDINIPTDVGLTFGNDGEKIEGDGTNLVVESSGTLDMNSGGVLTLDSGAAINLEPAAGSAILLDGTISVDAGVVTGATSITSTAFVGALTGNVTGNASGTAATVTGGTQASITTVANVVEVGALNAGSITSGFGTIDTGSSNITTTGTVSAEQLTTTDDLALSSSGAVINFNSGNITLTHADDELVLKSGDGNTLLGIDAASGSESILRFREGGTDKFQLVNAAGSNWISFYNHQGGGGDVWRVRDGQDDLEVVQRLFINDNDIGTTGAGDMGAGDPGLVINQGTGDKSSLVLKSSDVDHGMTTRAEIDTYAYFKKSTAGTTGGGLVISALTESINGVTIQSAATSANTTKGRGGTVAILMDCQLKDGTGVTTYVSGDGTDGTDGNLWGVADQAAGLVCMVDTEGQLYAVANAHAGDVSVGAIADSYDDAQLVRALDHAKTSAGARGLIRSRWDDFISYREQDLIDAGILGDTLENDGMLNVTGLQRLHNGAIWQGYVRQQEMQERIEVMETKLLALQEAN